MNNIHNHVGSLSRCQCNVGGGDFGGGGEDVNCIN